MSRKTFWTVVACFVAAIAITLAAWSILQVQTDHPLHAVMITKTDDPDYDFWNLVRRGAQAAARENDVVLEIWGPRNEDDVAGQIALVEEAAAQKPDFIVLSAAEKSELVDVCREVKKQGIGLIVMDSALAADQRIEDCFVGIRNTEAAAYLANRMVEQLEGEGQVAVVAHSSESATGADRIAAIEDVCREHPGIELVETVTCGDSAWMSYAQTKRLLAEHPDLAGIIATNQMCTEGAARALQEESDKDIAFFAFDTAPSQNQALEDGTADGFIVQQAFTMGYLSIEAGAQYCRSRLRTGTMDPGWIYVTKENMRDDDIQKLIYPFQSSE